MHRHVAFWLLATACHVTVASEIKSGSGNACPSDYAALGSVAACRAAMDLFGIDGYHYQGTNTEAEADWPKSCYLCDGAVGFKDGVWFNKHARGAARDNATPLCAKQGWETVLDKTKVLFVGDSDMDFWNTSSFLKDSQNVGYAGYTCRDTLSEIDEMLNVFKPEWVVMTCGENDLITSDVATTYPLFKQIVDKIVATGARVITLGTKPEPVSGMLHKKYEKYDGWKFSKVMRCFQFIQ